MEDLDGPAPAVAVDGERELRWGSDGKVGEQEPLDGRLAGRRLGLEYVDDVDPERGRLRAPCVVGSRQLDRRRGDAQPRDAVATSGMTFALGTLDLRSRRERHFPTEPDARRHGRRSE